MKSRISRPCNQKVEETLGGHVYGFALKRSIHNGVSTYVYSYVRVIPVHNSMIDEHERLWHAKMQS